MHRVGWRRFPSPDRNWLIAPAKPGSPRTLPPCAARARGRKSECRTVGPASQSLPSRRDGADGNRGMAGRMLSRPAAWLDERNQGDRQEPLTASRSDARGTVVVASRRLPWQDSFGHREGKRAATCLQSLVTSGCWFTPENVYRCLEDCCWVRRLPARLAGSE